MNEFKAKFVTIILIKNEIFLIVAQIKRNNFFFSLHIKLDNINNVNNRYRNYFHFIFLWHNKLSVLSLLSYFKKCWEDKI